MRYRPLLISLLVVALASALSACGGSDSTTVIATPTVPTLSKEQFIKQADAICAEVNAAVGTVNASQTDTGNQVSQRALLYNGMIERIQGLGSPSNDTGLAEFFTAGNQLVNAEKDAQASAEQNDAAGLASAETDADAALSSFQSAATSYGFKDCGQGPSAPAVTPTVVGGGNTPTSTTVTPVAPTTPATPVTPVTPTPTPTPVTPPAGGGGTPAPTPAPTPTPGTGGSGSGGISPG